MEEVLEKVSPVKLIAFYLPQYHPIPENDLWWGKGFTEWINVAKGRPRFPGHYQPHIPADLGFYDLRLPQSRQTQADLAMQYGIHGFCYYHYWFNGKRLLETPFNEVLRSGEPNLPFCLCWANENWTRRWDGFTGKILMEQKYSDEDDEQHMRWLASAFRDKRYIRVEDKPLFLVYKANKIPNPLRTTAIWREEAQRLGVGEIYLCRVESFIDEQNDPVQIGFDAAVEFQPDWSNLGTALRQSRPWNLLRRLRLEDRFYIDNQVFDYASIVSTMLQKETPSYTRYPCVMPSWDNTPRRKSQATVLKDSTPELYKRWLRGVIDKHTTYSGEQIVFINAWNEWAEGTHLEPCQQWGHEYLKATRDAVTGR